MAQAQPMQLANQAVHGKTTGQCDQHACQAAQQLADQADTPHTTQHCLTKHTAGNPSPQAAQAVQRPDTEHIVDLPAVLRGSETPDEQHPCHQAGDQRTDGMHEVGACTDRHQARQRPVVQETWVVAPGQQGRQGAADHGHQRVDRHQAADPLQGLGTHHVEAEPADDQDPRAQRQERNARRREGHQATVSIAPAPSAQQQHRRQRQPAAHRMHHHRAGKVVERRTEAGLQPSLHAEVAIPHHAFEEGVDERHDKRRGAQLRREARTFGDPPRDDRGNRGSEGQQEEALDQRIAVVGSQLSSRLQEVHAIGDPVADEEIDQCGDGEITEDLRQRVDLVLVAHGAHFEKGEAGVHGEHQNGAHEDEQGVGAVDEGVHRAVHVFHERGRPAEKSTRTVQEPASLHRIGASFYPVLLNRARPAWFFLGFVVDWVKVYRYPPEATPRFGAPPQVTPRVVANLISKPHTSAANEPSTHPVTRMTYTPAHRHRESTMASKSAKTAQEILMADFQALVRDTEKLLADTANLAGDQADELREQIHERLTQARETLQLTQESVRERGQAALGSAEQYVQENPWQAIGIAAGVGLLIGLLANRR